MCLIVFLLHEGIQTNESIRSMFRLLYPALSDGGQFYKRSKGEHPQLVLIIEQQHPADVDQRLNITTQRSKKTSDQLLLELQLPSEGCSRSAERRSDTDSWLMKLRNRLGSLIYSCLFIGSADGRRPSCNDPASHSAEF